MSPASHLARVFPQLFSALGGYGCGATATPDHRTPADFAIHAARLGVTHALVHQEVAREQDPTVGNARLLRELSDAGQLPVRLFPALAVAPTQHWERGGTDALRDVMIRSGSRALRAFPQTLRYRLPQLLPVLERVIDLKPFITVNVREIADANDIAQLAREFPTLPIILTQGMWPNLTTMYDLMHRFPNTLLETSWIHVWGVIEDAVRHFGADRIVFGLGPIAHQAAAVGGLAHANLNDAARHKIAFGNLAGLMGWPAAAAHHDHDSVACSTHGNLWRDFIHARPSTIPIIDAHGHLGAIGTWTVHEKNLDNQIQQVLARMDRLGFESMIISGLDALFSDPVENNLMLADKLDPHSPRLRAYFVFNAHYAADLPPLFDRCFARNVFAGFKLLNDYWRIPVTDPRFTPVWEYAHAHRLPILLHTWDGSNNAPEMLKDIAPKYPNAIFLLGHSGGGDGGRAQAEKLANANPNVRLEWCGSFCCQIPWEQTLSRVNHKQVVFGTDGVVHDLAWELARLLSLNVPDATLRGILGDNMRAVLAQRITP